jgi:heme/copper-type cytochrome/quinol oxidase subunit 3
MSDEFGLILSAIAIIAVCSAVSFFAQRQLEQLFSRFSAGFKFFFAALLPTLLMILILLVWEYYDYQEYLKGPQEGRMGPLLFLIYGFPFFVVNLACNFLAAILATRKNK